MIEQIQEKSLKVNTMFTITKALAGDFNDIYPILLELAEEPKTRDYWQRLFVNYWGSEEDFFGFKVNDGEKVVGFIGLVFSRRHINGEIKKFANITSWVVKKEYRSKGLGSALICETMKLKDYTIIVLTLARWAVEAFKKYGFMDLETGFKVIFPVPALNIFSRDCRLESGADIIREHLKGEDLKIFNDHIGFNCLHLLVRSGGKYCYIIATRTRAKGMAVARIHYISDLDIFLKCLPYIRVNLCLRLGVLGILVEDRFLKNRYVKYAFTFRLSYNNRLYWSDSLARDQITDSLYTEVLILGL